MGTVASTTTAATGGTVTLAQPGLAAGTTYYYRVTANNESGGVSGAATASAATSPAVAICGTKSVGPSAGADYPTLTAAFSAITVNGLCGPLVLELQASYVSTPETFPLVYSYAAATATNTVTVRPAAGATGLSITGTTGVAVFNIVGGKYLILDGRPGGSGTTVSGAAQATDLTIASTSTSGIPLQFTSDATFNLVQHCQVKGVGTSDSGSPDVNFTGTATTGNSDNTIQYCNIGDGATTPVTLVYGGNTLNSRNSLLNNNLFNNYGTGSTYGIYLNQAGTGWTITGNSYYQTANRVNVSGTMYGIYVTGAGHTIAGNFVGGSAASAGGTPLTVTTTSASAYAAYRFVGIFLATSGAATSVQGNAVANITWVSSSGATTTYGILSGIYVSTGDVNIGTTTGNTIGTAAGPIAVTTSTTGGYSFGISTASSGTVSIVGNTIANYTGVGSTATIASNVAGILASAGTANTLSRNKIYNLAAGSGVANLSTGIWLTGGTLNSVNNNLIGDLRAATSTSLVAVTGILVAGGTTNSVYYNTVNLAATSTGATFGTSGIYLNSTTAPLDLRNNIVVNKSTAAGTGGYSAALRRISGTAATIPANLATTTNNNLYYAGTPSATNLIYVEGTTTATNAQQTLAAYKAFLAGRESSSVTEDVPFLSTTGSAATFLHVSTTTPTQVEGTGTPISGLTTDFDGDTRSATTPDIGADEGTFTPLDLSGPTIVLASLPNTSSTASRTLAVTITDLSGISTTTPPRLFYRKGTSGAFVSALATSVSGSTYTFTFDYAAVGGVAAADVIQYYVVAQDVPGNVSSNPLGGTFTTLPTSVYQYTILSALSGVYYVGSGTSPDPTRTYATLTAAAAAYNGSGLGGAVTFLLLDATYSTAETFPLAFGNNPEASATNTLTIRPNAGVTAAITSAASALAFANARYLILDGSNVAGGTTRNLTVTSTSTTAGTYAIALLSTATTGPGNQFVTVRNTNVLNGSNTVVTYGIYVGNGPDNDNITLTNNSVQGSYYGIYAIGAALVSAGGMDNLVVSNNVVGPATASATANIGTWGILVASAVAPAITGNEVQNVSSANANNIYGIYLVDDKNAVVSRNSVHNISYTGASTYKVWAINSQMTNLTTAANPSAVRLDNNLVYNINSTTASATWNTVGINLSGGYGDQIVYNTVYLSGQLSAAGGTAGSAAFANGNPSVTNVSTNIDMRNNIFSIVGGTGGTASTPLYAHYEQATTVAGSTLNNNDLYVTAGATGLAAIGHLGTSDYATLALWRTATSQEANSVSVDPQFAQTTTVPFDLTPTNVALNNAGTPISGVAVDYTGATRGTLPDIGAYEFTPLTNDLAAVALLSPATTSTCYGTAEPVSVSVRNAGTAVLNFATSAATITVVVTLPGGTTQTLTTTLSTGTLASGAAQTVTLPTTLDMSTVGTYTFAITATVAGDGNTTNDLLTPAPTRTVAAPVAGTLAPAASSICLSGTATLTLTGAANGSIQYQSSVDNVTFTDIAGATSAAYTTPVLTATTYFRAQVRCNTGVATSNVSTITVNNPLVATTNTPLSICAGSTATLTATAAAGSAVRFFSAATGGTALTTTTAGSYTTPALTASTTYYAEAFVSNGSVERVGPVDNTLNAGSGVNITYAMVFNVTTPATLTGVYVYPTAAGVSNIQLLNSAGTVLQTYAATFTAADLNVKTFVPLSFSLPAGTGLQLGLTSTGSTASLYRNTAGAVYPYTSPSGNVSITGNTFTSGAAYYYYFYDWVVGTDCVGAGTRTPIQVNVTQPATAAFPAATASTCGTSAYQLAGTVTGSATTGTYTSSGTGTFAPNATTLNATYTPSAADVAAGSVTITLTAAAAAPCAASTATLTLSIGSAPVATFSYPATTTYCAGSAGTVAPTLGTGATAGTFTSTTGLTINATTGVITLSTSVAGTYTVTNTVAASGTCPAATATTTVTVSPAPVANAGAAAAICSGSLGQLGTTPVAGLTYSWSPATGLSNAAIANPTVTLTNTTGSPITQTYTLTVTNAGGCTSTATIIVTVNPVPARPTLAIRYNGTVTTLTSSAATGNQFYFNGVAITGATGQTYVVNGAPSTYGSYTVVVTNAFGCVSAASVPQVVTTTQAGIAGASLRVYPNPTPTGQLTLELSGFRTTTQLAVLDALGRVVATETLPATTGVVTHGLDLSRMASGVYLLRLTNADGVETRRLVRE